MSHIFRFLDVDIFFNDVLHSWWWIFFDDSSIYVLDCSWSNFVFFIVFENLMKIKYPLHQSDDSKLNFLMKQFVEINNFLWIVI